MMKENYQAARRFQEKPLEGCAVFAQDQEDVAAPVGGLTRREQHLQNKFSNPSSQPVKGSNQSKQQNQKEESKQPEAKRAEKQQPAPQQKKAEKAEKKPQLVYQAKTQPQP